MPSADFGGVVGVEPDPEMAVGYLRSWHGSLPRAESRLISVLCLPSRWCLTLPLGGLIGQIERSGLAELVYGGDGVGGGAQSVYVSAGTLATNPGRGKRGGKKESGVSAGCWADLDVGAEGSGRFAGWGGVMQAVEWFDAAGIGPTLVVGSGSGGAHLYWHVEGGLEPADVEVFGRRVRLWLEQKSGLVLDRVENSDRVLRLPGSVRWPKPVGGSSDGGEPGLCTVVREWNGRRVSREAVEGVTAEVWADWAGRTQAIRDGDLRMVRAALSGLADLRLGPGGGGAFGVDWDEDSPWGRLWAMAWAEDLFAESTSWSEILTPAGWRRNGVPDEEGRQEWCRPGGGEHSGRSLVVDWMGSPHVASLLSLAPETGLLGLEAAGAALTKARVAAELHWAGDLGGLMESFLSRRRAGLVGFDASAGMGGKGAGEA